MIVGPLVAAGGFAFFALELTSDGGYWRTFFPATVVLGLGMAVTVAPLTTVVMSSVDKDHSGAASGINNAVARLAGVLAIAVFGIVMVKVFSTQLERSLPRLSMAPEVAQQIRSKEIELAGIELPNSLHGDEKAFAKKAVSEAFLAGFRVVLFSCAGLAVGSAGVASVLVRKK